MIEELTSILTDPAHIIAELPYELTFLALHAGWVKWKFRKRDAEHGHVQRKRIRAKFYGKPAKGEKPACTSDPCTCSNGICCELVPFDRW